MLRYIILQLFIISSIANALPFQNYLNPRFTMVPDYNNVIYNIDLWNLNFKDTKFDPDEDIRYLLYTKKNPTDYQIIKKGNTDSLLASNFDPNKLLKVTIAGWQSDYLSPSNTLPRDAFLSVSDVNVITIDWTAGSQTGYTQAVTNTLKAGPKVAEFLDWINDMGVPYNKMHLMGNSLGGQMVGIIGRSVKGTIEYITAMDPASPSWGSNSQRIRKSDAKYVELIHSNVGVLGMKDAVGHNDFYPNRGVNMPGCDDFLCSHEMARQYFAESVISGGFTSVQCLSVEEALAGTQNCTGNKTLQLGGAYIKPEIGIFALETNSVPPFSKD